MEISKRVSVRLKCLSDLSGHIEGPVVETLGWLGYSFVLMIRHEKRCYASCVGDFLHCNGVRAVYPAASETLTREEEEEEGWEEER